MKFRLNLVYLNMSFFSDKMLAHEPEGPFSPGQLLQSKIVSRNERWSQKRAEADQGQIEFTENGLIGFSDPSKQEMEYFYSSKGIVYGKLSNNSIHGYCQIEYNDGSVFKGNYMNGSKVNGEFKFYDGCSYSGSFQNNQFHGEGTFTYPNGKIIEAKWNCGTIDGEALIKYPNNEIYYGSIKKLKKHGKGILYLAGNKKYVGEFHNGHIQGEGIFCQNNKIIMEGLWNKGRLVEQRFLQCI